METIQNRAVYPRNGGGEDASDARRRLALGLLAIATFTLPWQNVITVGGAATASRYVVAGTALVAAVIVFFQGRLRRPVPVHFLALAFFIWSGVSLIWSIDFIASLIRVLTIGQVAIIFWLIWEFARRSEDRLVLMQAYVLGAYILASGVFAGFFMGQGYISTAERYSAAGFNPNQAGMLLAVGVPIAWYLALRYRPRLSGLITLLNRLFVIIAPAAILLTGTRSSFIAVIVAFLFVVGTINTLSLGRRIIAFVAVSTGMAGLLTLVPQASFDRIGTIGSELASGDLSGRLIIWQAGLSLVHESPVLGVGVDGFLEAAAPKLFASFGKSLVAHNSFVSVVVELGVVGLLLFVTFLVAMYRRASRERGLERWFWLNLLVVWTLLAGLGDRQYEEVTWLIFGLLVAATSAPSTIEERVQHAKPEEASLQATRD